MRKPSIVDILIIVQFLVNFLLTMTHEGQRRYPMREVFKKSFRWNKKTFRIFRREPGAVEAIFLSPYYFIKVSGSEEGYFNSISDAIDHIKRRY